MTGMNGRSLADPPATGYYGVPPIHKPHWHWLIISYFFLGGLAGGSYVVASLSDLLGGEAGKRIARVGRYISFAALAPSPLLLILDLRRPERFLHMLRVLKLRSPMSLGVWGLVGFSAFSALSAVIQAARDGLLDGMPVPGGFLRVLPAKFIGFMGLAPAFFLSGYTGVLLAATAVPLWTKNYLLMGPLFLSSALSTSTAAIALVLSGSRQTSERATERLERLDSAALAIELGLLLAIRRQLTPTIARPLNQGRLARLERALLTMGLAAPLGLQGFAALFGWRLPRAVARLASLLVLAGGFVLRYLMVTAGRQSADDPAATFELAGAGDLPAVRL